MKLAMVDPVFGPLRFQAAGFWEGNVLFSPTQSTIEVIVNAGRDGPSDSQRAFLKDLEVRIQAFGQPWLRLFVRPQSEYKARSHIQPRLFA
jgi:hypothetical protein